MQVEAALQPAQLLPDVSAGQQLLVFASCGLMVPRALTAGGELMWFTGTCSGALLAAAQLLVLGAHAVASQVRWPGGAPPPLQQTACALALVCALRLLRSGWGTILRQQQQAAVAQRSKA